MWLSWDKTLKDFINKYHIIRRSLLIVFTYLFLLITYKIFFGNIILDTYKLSAYIFFGGIITLMIKFYHDSRDKEKQIDK